MTVLEPANFLSFKWLNLSGFPQNMGLLSPTNLPVMGFEILIGEPSAR